MIINIAISQKIATAISPPVIVCGNSDYVINFTFDSEWDEYQVKTARFVFRGDGEWRYKDVVFTGNTCAMPIMTNINECRVGVYAGSLHTSTPAILPCDRSILCNGGFNEPPTEDVYAQIMELLNNSGSVGEGGYTDAEINALLAAKADTGHTHTAAEIGAAAADHAHDELHTHANSDVLDGLSEAEGVLLYKGGIIGGSTGSDTAGYTQAETDALLATKADAGHTHTELHTHTNSTVLDKISESEDGILLFDGAEIQSGYSDTEIDTLLAGKADAEHSHSEYAAADHTHDELHSHTNSDVLGSLSEADGKLLFNGTAIEGTAGADGGYYTPAVDADGNLTWTASGEDMPEVAGSNIRGAKGDTGEQGSAGIYVGTSEEEATASGATIWVNPEDSEETELVTAANFNTYLSQHCGKCLWSSSTGALGTAGSTLTVEGISDYRLLLFEMTTATCFAARNGSGIKLNMVECNESTHASKAHLTVQARWLTLVDDTLTLDNAVYFRVNTSTQEISASGTPSAGITAIYGIF